MAVVEGKVTPVDPIVALAELCRAFEATLGRRPSELEAKVLWAGSSHETGAFQKMKNFGVGGVKAGPSWKGDVAVYLTTEYEGGVAVKKPQPFRAFRDVYEGFLDWLDILKRGYPLALAGAARGDVEAYVEGLTKGWGGGAHYFTAPKEAYAKGVWSNLRELSFYPIAWNQLTGRGPSGGVDV